MPLTSSVLLLAAAGLLLVGLWPHVPLQDVQLSFHSLFTTSMFDMYAFDSLCVQILELLYIYIYKMTFFLSV